jgi:pimeloyl-ACP methyl ester carboxylesterase
MNDTRTMVLVHGAWQGSWSWDAWLPILSERGWRAVALDLPGNGWQPDDPTRPADVSLDLYADHVCAVVKELGTPVVLVGHSGGGLTASQVADRIPDAISAVVYLAGMMLPHRRTFAELVAQFHAQHPHADMRGITPHLRWSSDGMASSVPPAAAESIFLHDCDAATALAAARKLRPQAEGGRNVAVHLQTGVYGPLPRIYVEALQDKSIALPLQRLMQSLSPGALRLSMDCGHVPQLVQAKQLADLLLPVLEQLPCHRFPDHP